MFRQRRLRQIDLIGLHLEGETDVIQDRDHVEILQGNFRTIRYLDSEFSSQLCAIVLLGARIFVPVNTEKLSAQRKALRESSSVTFSNLCAEIRVAPSDRRQTKGCHKDSNPFREKITELENKYLEKRDSVLNGGADSV